MRVAQREAHKVQHGHTLFSQWGRLRDDEIMAIFTAIVGVGVGVGVRVRVRVREW